MKPWCAASVLSPGHAVTCHLTRKRGSLRCSSPDLTGLLTCAGVWSVALDRSMEAALGLS